MKQKLAGITNRGNFRCKQCNILAPYYKDEDVINIFITSSTLANAHKFCFNETGLCDHTIEVFELNGQKIEQIQEIMTPILKDLIEFNKVRVLFAIGVNNLLGGLEQGNHIINVFDGFCKGSMNLKLQ